MNAHSNSFDGMAAPAQQPIARRSNPPLSPIKTTPRRRTKSTSLEYWLVFSVCFTVFIGALTLERLLPRSWRTLSDTIGAVPLLSEAWATAHRYSSIAFQG
jgi:hypothetical protein